VRRPGVYRCQRVAGGGEHATGAEPNRWTVPIRGDAGEPAHSGSPSGWPAPSATGGSTGGGGSGATDDSEALLAAALLLVAGDDDEDDEAEVVALALVEAALVEVGAALLDAGASLVDGGASLVLAGASVSSPVSGAYACSA
jgi:hypothetical protein